MSEPTDASTPRIVAFEARHAAAFKALNYRWIRRYFEIEPSDAATLEHPDEKIIARGGRILMAELDGHSIGTCALLRVDETTVELAKMAVDDAAQGRGVGRALGNAAVAAARAMGATRLVLDSNRKLTPALALYRSLGFVEVPGSRSPYARCDIQMALDLTP
ncbi:MAG: GNAT family N-acetyltransferase [Pseudomonadota bacterium]